MFCSISYITGTSTHVLDRHIFELNRFLSIDEIRAYLQSKGVLSAAEIEQLLNLSTAPNVTNSTIIAKLVGMLRGKGDEGLVIFKRGLEATLDGTGHAAILQTLNEDEEYLDIERSYNTPQH